MRKLTISLLCIMFLFCTVFSVTASAANRKYGSITITYNAGGVVFEDMDVVGYKIADMGKVETFTLTAPFDAYPINVNNIETQQEWNDLATTLTGYIQADEIWPDSLFGTDERGVVVLEYLDPGLYFIPGIIAQDGYTYYEFDPLFVYLPKWNDRGEWTYDVEARPKCSSYIPQTEYSVVKLWQDSANSARPQQVEVEIYKNGELHTTQQLNKNNDWKYTWQAEVDGSYWSVVERNVADGYTVSVTENNGVFSVVNTYTPKNTDDPTDPENPSDTTTEHKPNVNIKVPDTSDASSVQLYTALMCVSGLMLIILGLYRGRKNNEET